MNMSSDVLVLGGGAAGMFAAGLCASEGLHVTLLEKTDRLGKKLSITGKGRCNVTNDCSPEEFFKNVPRNPKFLYHAIYAFPPHELMQFFEQRNCALKTERGNRVFPTSDRASSILSVLQNFLQEGNVQVVTRSQVQSINVRDGQAIGASTDRADFTAKAIILATGGCSYPRTGSTGDGYQLASELGHTIIKPVGSLVPLVEKGYDCKQMQGLSLRNVRVFLKNQKGKTVFEDFGELLFTHFGLSGPVILSASAHMNDADCYELEIDLKPALDEQKLDARLLRDFEENQNRNLENVLPLLLPKAMVPVMLKRCAIDGSQKIHSITKDQRRTLLQNFKHFTVAIACKAPVEDAIITSGGIRVSEVEAKTMGSKIVKNLYFAGEILDVDAYTGGFNLQIAWSTAYTAAMGVVSQLKGE